MLTSGFVEREHSKRRQREGMSAFSSPCVLVHYAKGFHKIAQRQSLKGLHEAILEVIPREKYMKGLHEDNTQSGGIT